MHKQLVVDTSLPRTDTLFEKDLKSAQISKMSHGSLNPSFKRSVVGSKRACKKMRAVAHTWQSFRILGEHPIYFRRLEKCIYMMGSSPPRAIPQTTKRAQQR
jgi:hypothetical protein